MKKLSHLVKSILKENNPPVNWRSGFKKSKDDDYDSSLRLISGEEPFRIGEKWYLYIWDESINDITVYDFSSDTTIPYQDFQRQIGMMKESRKVSVDALCEIIRGR